MDDNEQISKQQDQREESLQIPTEYNYSSNATDGFFEKFGSLLRAKSQDEEKHLNVLKMPKCDVEEDTATSLDFYENNSINSETDICENVLPMKSIDNFGESFISSSSFLWMNVDDLYEEIIYEISADVGLDSIQVDPTSLIQFASNVFKKPNSMGESILANIAKKEAPKIRLNVELIKAEDLTPKDCNGLSDPFVTLYLDSCSSHRYNSSVKLRTLNPIWEEHFSLPIEKSPNEEVLVIEVWDFDAAETVKEKVHKIMDVKGIKGLSKLMKEIALTASTGKHDNELIGRTVVPIRSVSVSGMNLWCNLEKRYGTKSRGSVLINLTLSAEKNKQLAIQEHRTLLNLLLLHELDASKVAPFWWRGKFSIEGETLQSLHAMHGGLTNFECSLSQWIVYATIHEKHPLSFKLFNDLLDTILRVLKYRQNESEDYKIFWQGVRCILPSCFSILRKMRSTIISERDILKTLCEVLSILSKIRSLDYPNYIELFPENIYGWMNFTDGEDLNIENILVQCVNLGTSEWLEGILHVNQLDNSKDPGNEQLQSLIRIVQMIRADLQRAMEFFDKHFYNFIQINYSTKLYEYFANKLVDISKPIVEKVCSQLKRINIPEYQFEIIVETSDFNMGTTLFELYLVMKKLHGLGKRLGFNDESPFDTFFKWFVPGVTHWLDISIWKALHRIQKAIYLDKLQPIDKNVKYSTSAVDTLAIFYQIKTFWTQLDWPDIEGRYTFVAKIVDDICRCCIFYAQKMSYCLEKKTEDDSELFSLSIGWCLAINNIDYIRLSLPSFVTELGIEEIITDLGEFRSNLEAERCRDTMKNVVDNAIDIQKNQVIELIEKIASKMHPYIRRYLSEGAEVLHEESNSMEKLMVYLENSLSIVYSSLNNYNFERTLDAVWFQISVIMNDLIQINVEKRRPPEFFRHLQKTLNTMLNCFKVGDMNISSSQLLQNVEFLLKLHSCETADLIHQYYRDQIAYYDEDYKGPTFGVITIQCTFFENSLLLKILNGSDLATSDQDDSCSSFVKVQFSPASEYSGTEPIKTSVKHKTRFPLYDEEFTISLTNAQQCSTQGVMILTVKNKEIFGMGQFIGETYVSMSALKSSGNNQIHLKLYKPKYSESNVITALEKRSGDKQGKEFLRKLRKKSNS